MIICAAICIDLKEKEKSIIIPCLRHRDGWKLLKELRPDLDADDFESAEEGFLTNDGLFLSRIGAYHHALLIGQLPTNLEITNKILMSEDLY